LFILLSCNHTQLTFLRIENMWATINHVETFCTGYLIGYFCVIGKNTIEQKNQTDH
jgi:hypothetical protein